MYHSFCEISIRVLGSQHELSCSALFRALSLIYRQSTMASYNRDQNVRLRNLGSHTSTSVDDEALDAWDSVTIKDRELVSRRRRVGLRTIIFFLSLVLNFIGAWKMLFSRTPRDRILTYCEPSIQSEFFSSITDCCGMASKHLL